MPYVGAKVRAPLDAAIRDLPMFFSPGELNYYITRVCLTYLDRRGLCYSSLNDTVGVLECAKQELYRRVAAPYEDAKCAQNGDVYGYVASEYDT